jgi:hypothetical protein
MTTSWYSPYRPDFSEDFLAPFDDAALYLSSSPDNVELALSNALYEISRVISGDGSQNPDLRVEVYYGTIEGGVQLSRNLCGYHLPGVTWQPAEPFTAKKWEAITEMTPGSVMLQQDVEENLNLIIATANKFLPSFIGDEAALFAELDPSSLISGNGVISVVIQKHEERFLVPYRELSAGTRRWISNTLQLSIAFLTRISHIGLNPEQIAMSTVTIDGEEVWTGGGFAGQLINEPKIHPLENTIITIDEPEVHLHPSAVSSILDWILRLEDLGATCVVATHSLKVFDESAEFKGSTQRFVSGESALETANFRSFSNDASNLPTSIRKDLGISAGELYLLTKRVILVEGKQDVAFLEGYFEKELRETGAHLFPLFGTRNLGGKFDKWDLSLELMKKMGFKISGILLDKMSTEDPEIVRRLNGVESLHTVVLDKIDIWMYIDKTIFNEWLASEKKKIRLSSWEEDLEEARSSGSGVHFTVKTFKRFVSTKYHFAEGASFTKRLKTFGREQRRRNLIDEELRKKFLGLLEL